MNRNIVVQTVKNTPNLPVGTDLIVVNIQKGSYDDIIICKDYTGNEYILEASEVIPIDITLGQWKRREQCGGKVNFDEVNRFIDNIPYRMINTACTMEEDE